MTCEIAIMNKHAIVLAADSATTVTQWVKGNREERYFKGTNKIFQLSSHRPIGMMIYDAANLQGVPWEIIAKDFRDNLGRKSFNDIDGYAKELFSHIKNHGVLFPAEFQKASFVSDGARAAMLHLWFEVLQKDTVKNAASDADKKAAIEQILDEDTARIDAEALCDHFEQAELDDVLAAHTDDVAASLQDQLTEAEDVDKLDLTKLAGLAIKLLVKHYSRYMDMTGVVLAGFGDHDYFPVFREYKCYGLLLGKFLFDEGDSKEIGRDTPSFIKPFATTAMVNTFVVGFSPDVFNTVRQETTKTIRAFAESLANDAGVQLGDDLNQRIEAHLENHTTSWTTSAAQNHAWPLQRVIGSLPVDEMAELAETLIMLESLKEKVTQPTESVGGPIDVCVISKADGFVWVKRKHYFNPELNPQFFRRQGDKFN